MKISVVMATYNGAKYLKEQLESIYVQTRPVDELIICDDGSTDGTVELAKRYIEEKGLKECWKVVVNEKNLGYANNFHKVTLLAEGDLILFADQDDIWHNQKIERMESIMNQHPDCKVLCTDYEPLYDGENVQRAPKSRLRQMPDNKVLKPVKLTARSSYIGALGCCMCVRKEAYHQWNTYWFDGWAQDDRMWRLSQCAEGCYLYHDNLIQHRIHGNNTSTYGKYHSVEKRVWLFESMLKADQMMKQMLLDNGAEKYKISLMNKHIKMMQYRIDLLKNKHLYRLVPLIFLLRYYQEPKSFLVDVYIAMKGK